MSRLEVRVARDRPLSVGDELTFFYPSTEWDMVQPFHCNCGCLGIVGGCQGIAAVVREQYRLNIHIEELTALSVMAGNARDEVKVSV